MHELGIISNTIKTINEVMAEQGLTELDTIVLEVGEMNDAVPRFLEEAWLALREATPYPTAKMKIDIVQARARCTSCGHTDLVKALDIECPICHSTDFKIISGREFNIKHIIAR